MQKVRIRGIELLAADNRATLCEFLLNAQALKKGMLVAINAEKVILAEEDKSLKVLLAEAEYKYADGISIVKSIQRKYPQYQNKIERIAGVDLWVMLMQQAAKLGVPVFLIGATAATVNETAERLRGWNVPIVGIIDGYTTDEQSMIEQIKQSGAKFVSVAMGSPKQEWFIRNAQQHYPDCLYMGVGGTYDIFVGNVKRAPEYWQKYGLEWFYRLLQQPNRWRRQLRLLKYAYYYATKQL